MGLTLDSDAPAELIEELRRGVDDAYVIAG